jgi:hypothetical protein
LMRVYLATTLAGLARAHETGVLTEPGAPAHAVTPAVREWYVSGDDEELEYTAMVEAAEASLRALAFESRFDPDLRPRRVVVAADVPEGAAAVAAPGSVDGQRSAVVLRDGLALAEAVSIHLDEEAAEPVVQAALSAVEAADAGEDDAQFLLDEVEACDLLWFDVTEITDLLGGPPV